MISTPEKFGKQRGLTPLLSAAKTSRGCKLRPLIRDKVPGGAVGANGLVDERRHGVGGGLGQEHLGGERHAGEDVDHDSEFEREDPKETGDLGQIGHPYMVRPSSLYAALRQQWLRFRDALLLPDPGDGAWGDSSLVAPHCAPTGITLSVTRSVILIK